LLGRILLFRLWLGGAIGLSRLQRAIERVLTLVQSALLLAQPCELTQHSHALGGLERRPRIVHGCVVAISQPVAVALVFHGLRFPWGTKQCLCRAVIGGRLGSASRPTSGSTRGTAAIPLAHPHNCGIGADLRADGAPDLSQLGIPRFASCTVVDGLLPRSDSSPWSSGSCHCQQGDRRARPAQRQSAVDPDAQQPASPPFPARSAVAVGRNANGFGLRGREVQDIGPRRRGRPSGPLFEINPRARQ